MKELEVTLRVRNNRLKERRDALGFTQVQLARAAGIVLADYQKLEGMSMSPLHSGGDWKKCVMALASFHCVEPEDLFPPGTVAISKPRAVRKLNADELRSMLHGSAAPATAALEEGQTKAAVGRALAKLSPTEAIVIRGRFGFDSEEPLTLSEVGKQIGVSGTRARQIEMRALAVLAGRKLYRSVAANLSEAVGRGDGSPREWWSRAACGAVLGKGYGLTRDQAGMAWIEHEDGCELCQRTLGAEAAAG